VFTMPDKMSLEKVNMLKAFGAEVVITPTDVPGDSPQHYVETAKRIARETPGAFYVNQYHNPLNIDAHEMSTGPEIWRDSGGKVDAVVAGAGTGGHRVGDRAVLQEEPQARAHRRGRSDRVSALPLLLHQDDADAARVQGRGDR
jgi:cystathionine beta-synthase